MAKSIPKILTDDDLYGSILIMKNLIRKIWQWLHNNEQKRDSIILTAEKPIEEKINWYYEMLY